MICILTFSSNSQQIPLKKYTNTLKHLFVYNPINFAHDKHEIYFVSVEIRIMVCTLLTKENTRIMLYNNKKVRYLNGCAKAANKTLIGKGRGGIFIYSCSARRVSFQIKFKLIKLKGNKYVGQNLKI